MAQKPNEGILVIAAGVAAAFVVAIGTGYRVTGTPGNPIGDYIYYVSIGVLLGAVVTLIQRFRAPTTRAEVGQQSGLDTPELTDAFTRLRATLTPLAERIGAPAELMPTMLVSMQNGLPHVAIDGNTFHYVHEERGVQSSRFSTTSLDELLYHIFRDVAWSMASTLARPRRKPGQDFRREHFKQQLALLGRLDPEWESRCAAEHDDVLADHPFVDEG